MYWLFTENEEYNFKQIFNNIVENNIDNNKVIDTRLSNYNTNKELIYNDKMVIYIKDSLITYKTRNKKYCFKHELISTINRSNTIELVYKYQKQDENKMPNLLEKEYDYYYINEYKIYKLNNNTLLIEEFNTRTNITRKYLLEKM